MNNLPKHKKRVVISTDLCGTYAFFTPITALLWDRIAGYFPIVLVCGEINKQLKYAMDFTKDLGSEVFRIKSIPGYTDQNVSQVSRLFAAALPVSDDSYILTADIDMWPLSKSYFSQQDLSKDIHLFGANTSNHTKYPICYIGMNASVWRDVMKLNTSVSIEQNIEEKLDVFLKKNPSSDDGWYFDEKFFASMIKSWNGYPHKCHMINRGWSGGLLEGRVDRARWSFNGVNSSHVDSHVLRPGYYDECWPYLVNMLESLLPDSDVDMFRKYKDTWTSL